MLRKIAAYSLKQAAYTVDSLCAAIASSLTKISRSECAAYLANSDMVNLIGKRSNGLKIAMKTLFEISENWLNSVFGTQQ
jgi:hypothetical protein